jgi:hypothetical protein
VLVDVDRPTVGELVNEQEIVLRMISLGRRTNQFTSTSQLDAYDIGGHPDAQFDGLL